MQAITMKRAHGEEEEVWRARRRIALYVLLLIVGTAAIYVLAGILTAAPERNQLTLVDNTTQFLVAGDWTDVTYAGTLQPSVNWAHAANAAEVTSLSTGLFNVYFAVNPVAEIPTNAPTTSPTESPTTAPTEAPCPPGFNIQTRVLRQRGSNPAFVQIGPDYTPVLSAGSVQLTVLQLDTTINDVYKFQWTSSDCPSLFLSPIDIDLGLLGVPQQGVQPVSTYLVITNA